MALETSKGTWLQVPAYDVSDTLPSDPVSCYRSCLEHYRACRRAHAGARLLGTISFHQVKRFKLYASEAAHNSSYEEWAHSFKSQTDNCELQTADMEWLARAGGIISFVMRLDNLPDQGSRADYMVQEVGSIKQLKTLFPKVFNKNIKWNDGERLQDVFPHDFRRIKDALKAPGTLAKLYKDKRAPKAAKAETVSGTAEQMFPSATQAEERAAHATNAAGAAVSQVDSVEPQSFDSSTLRESPDLMFAPAAPTPAAPAATATTAGIAATVAVFGSRLGDMSAQTAPVSTLGAAVAVYDAAAHSAGVQQQLQSAEGSFDRSSAAAAAAAAIAAAGMAAGVAGGAEPAVPTLQTALSGVGGTVSAQAEQHVLWRAAHQGLRPGKTPPLGPLSEKMQSAELPARPQSPFQEFLHVLIDGNSGSSADEQILPPPLELQQQLQEHEQCSQAVVQQQGQDEGSEKEQHSQQQQERQGQQNSGGEGEFATAVKATAVSGAVLPAAASAVMKTGLKVQPKRASCALPSVDKPGALPSVDKPGPRKKVKQDKVKAAGDGAAVAAGVVGRSSGAPAAGTSSRGPDSTTTTQDIVMQQQLLRRLQQQGVMGAPLVQWLKGYAARIQQGTAPIVDLQEDHLLDQVCVVEKWSKEISPLLRLEHSRAFMVLVLPEQQLAQRLNSADDLHTECSDEIIQQKQHTASAQHSGMPSEWAGAAADWTVPHEMLSACRALKTFQGAEGDRIVASHAGSNLQLRRNDLACLRAPAWLSDECVNFYMALLQDRDHIMYDTRHLFREGTGAYRTFFFNSHFMSKLKLGRDDYDFSEVRRWTIHKQQVTIEATDNEQAVLTQVLKYDRLVIPIHQQTPYQHWTVLLIDLQQRRLVFFDSYKQDNPIGPMAMERVKLWLANEAQDKLGEAWQTADWAEEYPKDLPRQDNDYDCGVYALMACNCLGLKGRMFDFDQDYMVNLRAAIAHDLQASKVVASANPACVS